MYLCCRRKRVIKMRNIKLILEFDGSSYSGWMKQGSKDIPTLQAAMESAVYELTGEQSDVIGCSRTDAGVHAINYTANFMTESTIPAERFYKALNPLLPEDIKVKSSSEMPEDFHSAFSVANKTYRYYFYYNEFEFPLLRNKAWRAAPLAPLDKDEILRRSNTACGHFKGTHDFSAFKASGGLAKTTERTIYYANVNDAGGNVYFLEICGDGFLYNMVRIIAGTIAGVISGRFEPDDIPDIINSKNRKRAGMTAPPHGLYLYKTEY